MTNHFRCLPTRGRKTIANDFSPDFRRASHDILMFVDLPYRYPFTIFLDAGSQTATDLLKYRGVSEVAADGGVVAEDLVFPTTGLPGCGRRWQGNFA